MHETAEEAMAETEQMLNVYADFCEQELAIPVIRGKKTDKEKFAGAEATYTIEAMMHDGKALQSGTSHFFGDGFSRAFGIQYTDRENKLQYPFQTSWGMSTRIIGAIIMTHGDDNGLVLPPAVAPVQVEIIPIATHKAGVIEKATELKELISKVARTHLDDSDNTPGWKFAQCEMRGIPLRVEIGPKDIEANQCVVVRRDNLEKTVVSLDELEARIPELLKAVHDGLYSKALERREAMTYEAFDMDEMVTTANEKSGFIKAMWCGELECEELLKDKAGVSSRCMPFGAKAISDKCVCCSKPAKHLVYWGKAY